MPDLSALILVCTLKPSPGESSSALLARQMNVPLEDIQKAHEWIRRLDPRPGRAYDSSRTIYVEPDVRGSFVQDCEVCCNPWRVRVFRSGGERDVEIARADGSE